MLKTPKDTGVLCPLKGWGWWEEPGGGGGWWGLLPMGCCSEAALLGHFCGEMVPVVPSGHGHSVRVTWLCVSAVSRALGTALVPFAHKGWLGGQGGGHSQHPQNIGDSQEPRPSSTPPPNTAFIPKNPYQPGPVAPGSIHRLSSHPGGPRAGANPGPTNPKLWGKPRAELKQSS